MQFTLHEAEYGVAEFYRRFEHDLPQIAQVTQGYCGEIVQDTFDNGQIIRLHTVSKQKRVLTQAKLLGRPKVLGIPLDYREAKFCVIGDKGKSKKEEFLDDILKQNKKLPLWVQFPRDKAITVWNQTLSTNHFPILQLTRTYEEIYLLGNFINDGQMSPDVIPLPLYLTRVRMSLVRGIAGATEVLWQKYQKDLDRIALDMDYKHEYANSEISEYQGTCSEDTSDDLYAYIEPAQYCNFVQLFGRRDVTPTEPRTAKTTNQIADAKSLESLNRMATSLPYNQEHPGRTSRLPPPPLPSRRPDKSENRRPAVAPTYISTGQKASQSADAKSHESLNSMAAGLTHKHEHSVVGRTSRLPQPPLSSCRPDKSENQRPTVAPTDIRTGQEANKSADAKSHDQSYRTVTSPTYELGNSAEKTKSMLPPKLPPRTPDKSETLDKEVAPTDTKNAAQTTDHNTDGKSYEPIYNKNSKLEHKHETHGADNPNKLPPPVLSPKPSKSESLKQHHYENILPQGRVRPIIQRQGETVHSTENRAPPTAPVSHNGMPDTSTFPQTSAEGPSKIKIPTATNEPSCQMSIKPGQIEGSQSTPTATASQHVTSNALTMPQNNGEGLSKTTLPGSATEPQLNKTTCLSNLTSPVCSPEDIPALEMGDVAEYLKLLNLDKYIKDFRQQMIDGELLKELDKDMLIEEFGMKPIEALRLVKFITTAHIPT